MKEQEDFCLVYSVSMSSVLEVHGITDQAKEIRWEEL